MVAIAVGGRYKISPQTALTVDYSQPITEFLKDNPHPGISLGVEFSTSASCFSTIRNKLQWNRPSKELYVQ